MHANNWRPFLSGSGCVNFSVCAAEEAFASSTVCLFVSCLLLAANKHRQKCQNASEAQATSAVKTISDQHSETQIFTHTHTYVYRKNTFRPFKMYKIIFLLQSKMPSKYVGQQKKPKTKKKTVDNFTDVYMSVCVFWDMNELEVGGVAKQVHASSA